MPDETAGLTTLARCVGDARRFLDSIFGRHVHVDTAQGRSYDDLLSLDEVDRLVTSAGLRTPLFRLVKDGAPLPPASYTTSGRIGGAPLTGVAEPRAVLAALDAGATLVLQGMQRYALPLARLCRDLELALAHPCQVNAYITPPGGQGLGVHSDAHDVIVLQAFGTKSWEVHAAPAEPPRDAPRQVVLHPGDTLYLPRGTPHAAAAQESLSGHLTIGILTTTWRALLDEVVARLRDEPLLDEPLPTAYYRDRPAFAATVAERLGELARRIDKSDATELADRLVDRFLTTRPPLLAGGLGDRTRLAGLADSTLVRRRPGTVCELRPDGDPLRLLLGDRVLRVPAWVGPAVREVAARSSLRVGDLAPWLDEVSRLVLVRRLVREGLLEVVVDR